jgi:hypothetical protein
MLLDVLAAHEKSLLEGEANQNQEANISHCDILSRHFCILHDFFRSLLGFRIRIGLILRALWEGKGGRRFSRPSMLDNTMSALWVVVSSAKAWWVSNGDFSAAVDVSAPPTTHSPARPPGCAVSPEAPIDGTGSDRQFALQRPEDHLGLGELDILCPEFFHHAPNRLVRRKQAPLISVL